MSVESLKETFVSVRLFKDAPFAAGQVKEEDLGTFHEHVDLSFSSLPGREPSVLQAGKCSERQQEIFKKYDKILKSC